MKKLMTITLALSLIAMSSMAFAQPEPDDIGVFADMAGTISTLDFAGGGGTTFYVVAFDMQNFNGYEFGVNIPGDWFIQSTTWLAPDGVTPTVFGDARNAQVGAGGCLDGAGANVLAAVTVATFSAVGPDTPLCIGPSDPTSFPNSPVPGYNTCDSVLIPFGVAQNGGTQYPNGCLILNATGDGPVATEGASFGEVKARF